MRRRALLGALAATAGARGASAATRAVRTALPASSPFEGMTHTLLPGGSLAELLKLARDGDTIAILPGVHRAQVGVVTQRRLTLRGIGTRPVLEAAGAHAEGKGMLVVRDGDVTVENLEFRGARVPDGNGAGIRFEQGRLSLQRCAFLDNQMGLLTGNQPGSEVVIRDCEFGLAPRGGNALPHLCYVGRIARLEVSGSRFHAGWDGHLLKSRARESVIESNLLVDGPQGEASYELDLPEGGLAWLVGNVIGQSERTRNNTLVSFGEEGGSHPEHGLFMAHNTLVNERKGSGTFVRVAADKLGRAVPMRCVNNLLAGRGEMRTPGVDWSGDGNQAIGLEALDAPALLQFRPVPGSPLRGRGVAPGSAGGRSLVPATEFTLPVGTRALAVPARWTPGALQ